MIEFSSLLQLFFRVHHVQALPLSELSLIGVSRTVAAEYTFFLAIPVMFGASLLETC